MTSLWGCKSQTSKSVQHDVFADSISLDKHDSITRFEENAKFYENSNQLESYIIDKDSVPPNTIINFAGIRCAVFKTPNPSDIAEMKKEYGEEDFYIVADDNLFYQYEAKLYLDSMSIKTINVYDSRYVLYINQDRDTSYLDLKAKYGKYWNLLFFDPGKEPKIVDDTDIENEYKEFFK